MERLPDGLTKEHFEKIRDAAGLQALTLGFDIDLEIKPAVRSHAMKRGYPTVLLRIILIAVGFYTWNLTE